MRRGGVVVRGGSWVEWWDEGEGTESALRLHFHLRKIGRIYIKIHLHPYTPPDYLCDFNWNRSRERKPYLLQNPG